MLGRDDATYSVGDVAESDENEHDSACDPRPYEISEPTKIQLRVMDGELVKGHLRELQRQGFEWYIANEENMILLLKSDFDRFKSVREGRDEVAYKGNWRVNGEGPWYLILDMYMKQIRRRVEVNLRHTSSRKV